MQHTLQNLQLNLKSVDSIIFLIEVVFKHDCLQFSMMALVQRITTSSNSSLISGHCMIIPSSKVTLKLKSKLAYASDEYLHRHSSLTLGNASAYPYIQLPI